LDEILILCAFIFLFLFFLILCAFVREEKRREEGGRGEIGRE
jgi:hypothetical protein